MAKDYTNQHVVPNRYLKRFAIPDRENSIIDTCYIDKQRNEVRFFQTDTSRVGYVKEFYDVTNKKEPKYWEHYLDEQFDRLCGEKLSNIIANINLSVEGATVINEDDKTVLSRIVLSQLMRVPSSVQYIGEIVKRTESRLKEKLKLIPSRDIQEVCDKILMEYRSSQRQKELFMDYSFDKETFERYANILKSYIWSVYINPSRNGVPFYSCDNPVLLENVMDNKKGLFHNGLLDPNTCFYFPLTPYIAVAGFSKTGTIGISAESLDGKKVTINDATLIHKKNILLMKQSFKHVFIPKSYYLEICNAYQAYMGELCLYKIVR